jgi:hypothetical protein
MTTQFWVVIPDEGIFLSKANGLSVFFVVMS